MAAYRWVCDSRHLQADCQEPGSAPEPSLGNRLWATFTFLTRDKRTCLHKKAARTTLSMKKKQFIQYIHVARPTMYAQVNCAIPHEQCRPRGVLSVGGWTTKSVILAFSALTLLAGRQEERQHTPH